MQAMRWAHLPLAGGMYDQHPDFINKMKTYMSIMNKAEAAKAEKEKAKAQSGGRSGPTRRPAGRRR